MPIFFSADEEEEPDEGKSTFQLFSTEGGGCHNNVSICCSVSGSPLATEDALDGMLYLPEVVQRQIQLSSNTADNQLLRSDFCYEQVWRHTLTVSVIVEFCREAAVVIQ